MNPDNLRFLGKINNIKYIDNLYNAQKHKLVLRASFMVGLPFDTDDTIERYFKYSSELPLSEYAVYPLIPYPGTLIYEKAKQFHYNIISENYENYRQMGVNGDACYVLEYHNPNTSNHFGPADVRRWKIRAEQLLDQHFIHMRNSSIAN